MWYTRARVPLEPNMIHPGLICMRALLAAFPLMIAAVVAVAGSLEEAKTANDKGDLRTAVRIYSELSNQGERTAQLQLGLMYDEGRGVPRHYQQAVRWYTVASSQGDPDILSWPDLSGWSGWSQRLRQSATVVPYRC